MSASRQGNHAVRAGTSPLLTTLLPTVVGALQGFGAALLLKRNERSYLEEREWFDKQRTQARELDDALVMTQLRVRESGVTEDESRWGAAHREWEGGWVRVTPFLDSPELESRYRSVRTILTELRFYTGQASITQQVSMVQRAIANARQALAYFVRGTRATDLIISVASSAVGPPGEGDPDSLARGALLPQWLAANPEGPGTRSPERRTTLTGSDASPGSTEGEPRGTPWH
jgi:hypothetical protein